MSLCLGGNWNRSARSTSPGASIVDPFETFLGGSGSISLPTADKPNVAMFCPFT